MRKITSVKAWKSMISILLTFVMILSLTACGDNTSQNGDENENREEADNNQDNASDEYSNGEDGSDENKGDDTNGETEGNAAGEENEDDTNGDENGATENGEDGAGADSGDGSGNADNSGDTGNSGNSGNTGDSGSAGSSTNSGTSTQGGTIELSTKTEGSGTETEPYLIMPQINEAEGKMTIVAKVPAGAVMYCDIYRVNGMIMIIEDASAYVIDSNGSKHEASNGKVYFEVKDEKALASDTVSFQIGNSGSETKTYTITFVNKHGSYSDPEIISSLANNSYSVSLEKGNDKGYYYKYYAEKDGVIRFSISSITDGVDGAVRVTNNRTYAQRALGEDGDEYIEIEVQKGDELLIAVSVVPVRNKYAAADITWLGQYVE